MSKLKWFFRIIGWIIAAYDKYKEKKLRAEGKQEGRTEVLNEIEDRNDKQAKEMEGIREDIAVTPLSELEQRMSAYERSDP